MFIMIIHKSHSKTDLIDIINFCNLPIIFNHSDNKKSLHKKYQDLFKQENIRIESNHFRINNLHGLQVYLVKPNPKKQLTIKEKSDVMTIAKSIIYYATHKYDIFISPHYKDTQTILDDMLYIKGFGDIPSVRRACRLMNSDPKFKGQVFNPLISPQVMKSLEDKVLLKKKPGCFQIQRKEFTLVFQ